MPPRTATEDNDMTSITTLAEGLFEAYVMHFEGEKKDLGWA
jgi:hypothetical protein